MLESCTRGTFLAYLEKYILVKKEKYSDFSLKERENFINC